jgi:hypothetical protein
MIDDYRSLGLDIAVVEVGNVVQQEAVGKNPKLLFDDGHHPGCGGVQMIANMLQYVFYHNLAQDCPDDNSPVGASISATNLFISPHETTLGGNDPFHRQLWDNLFRDDVEIASITAWEPRIHNASNLQVANGSELFAQWPTVMAGKADPLRQDRKNSYVVPHCARLPETTPYIPKQITLLEPNLKWLGLALGKNGENTVLHVNGIPISTRARVPPWSYGLVWISQWVPVFELVPKAESYVISLCHNNTNMTVAAQRGENFMHLVGVSAPERAIE